MKRTEKTIAMMILVLAFALALSACGQSKESKAADEAIKAIGTVTLSSEQAITDAEKLVGALEEKDKEQLKELETLKAARAELDALKKEAEANAAAAEIVQMINNIGETNMRSCAAIEAARDAYTQLDQAAKDKVTNYSKLHSAESEFKAYLAAEKDGALSRMTIDRDEVNNISFYTPKQMPYYNNSRCAMLPYVGQSGNTPYLKLRFNYAGDDWVFFKQATIAVDEARYYKFFKYFDITHDNGGGMVGELIDIDPTKDDMKMLAEVTDSAKTIVRFEGDDHYYDFTLTDKDKSAIRDTLIVFYCLKFGV